MQASYQQSEPAGGRSDTFRDLLHAGELKVPRIPRTRDRSEGGAAKRAVRIVQRRSVADVEDFRAGFKTDPLRQAVRWSTSALIFLLK